MSALSGWGRDKPDLEGEKLPLKNGIVPLSRPPADGGIIELKAKRERENSTPYLAPSPFKTLSRQFRPMLILPLARRLRGMREGEELGAKSERSNIVQ